MVATCVLLIIMAALALVSAIHTLVRVDDGHKAAVRSWVLNCVQIKATGIQEPLCDAYDIETERRKILQQ